MADITVDLNPSVDEVVIEDVAMEDDPTAALASNISKRKGRGFQDGNREARHDLKSGGFETVSDESVGQAQRSVEGWIVLVTNVHEEATEEDVMEKFAEFGDVKNIHLNLDRRTGYVKGYALIEYDAFNDAQAAIENSNGTELLGKIVNADFAFVRGAGESKSIQQVTTSRRNRGDGGRRR